MPNTNSSPRTKIPLSWPAPPPPSLHTYAAPPPPLLGDRALIVGRYKIICGNQAGDGFWQGPVFPNGSSDPSGSFPGCVPDCCLFDIVADETEQNDLRTVQPSVFSMMERELAAMGETVYQTDYAEPNTTECITNEQAEQLYGGFIGPMCFKKSPFPPTPPPPPPRRFSLSRQHASGRQCLQPAPGLGAHIMAGPCSGGTADAVWAAEYGPTPEQGWVAHESGNGTLSYIKLDEHTDANTTTKADFCRRGRVYLNADAGNPNQATHQGFVFSVSNGTIGSTYCDSPLYRCLVVPESGDAAHGGSCDDADAKGWVQTFES